VWCKGEINIADHLTKDLLPASMTELLERMGPLRAEMLLSPR
jgi:hypothetical protein